jgi:hypothetical protein
MLPTLNLLPYPRKVKPAEGTLNLAQSGLIALNVPRPTSLLFTAQRLRRALEAYVGPNWEAIGGGYVPAGIRLTLDDGVIHTQGYHLVIASDGIRIAGHDEAGIFYGVATLIQLLQTHGAHLPLLEINDWPDFPQRGLMLDISRDKVPTMETLYMLVDMLASWKINQFQLYIEHTFAYRQHPEVWAKASPMTAEQILSLDAYCRQRYIDLVPNQNSFGHMHRWFEHTRYLPLAETESGIMTPWGEQRDHPFSLSPAVPGAIALIEDLYRELLPNFTSKLFNVGCDETFDLGVGRSKALVAAKGKGRVYLDFLLQIYGLVKARGRTMQFWGDIINQHPDLVPELPKDSIALEWGYEATHDFSGKTALFARSGIPYYVCPGTSSWTTIAGRTDNAIANIRSAAENGFKNGAVGLLNTDWGDHGHWQQLPVSYLGFAYGAALGWACSANAGIDLPAAVSTFAFRDKAAIMGKLAYDLGNAYQKPGVLFENGSLLFWLYQWPLDLMRQRAASLPEASRTVLNDDDKLWAGLHSTLEYIDGVIVSLDRAEMTVSDADLLKHEFTITAHMLRHGARRGLLQLGDTSLGKAALLADLDAIEEEYRALWLARNRPGGLDDSAARLRAARQLYAT